MLFDPKALDLERLFRDPDMFDSREAFRDAGFKVFDRNSPSKIMVGSHRSVNGYLFKKYGSDVSLKEQLANYKRRIEGAQELRKLIEEKRLQHVVVPQKWLYELPRKFSSGKRASHVLVVERLDLLDEHASQRNYHRIDEDVLEELCTVFFAFRGLDSTTKNVPFTEDGRIAFIDTEHWDRHMAKKRRRRKRKKSKKPFLRHIREYLSVSRQDLADEIFEELEDDD